jgi:DNA-binding transcriptional LysR family regulator
LTLNDLDHSAWILQPLTSPARQILEQEFGQHGLMTPENLVECTSIFATLQLLQKSDAVTVLPESVVRDHLQAGLLIRLALDVGKSLPGFGILTRRGEALSSSASEFIESLRKYGALMGTPDSGQEVASKKPRRSR